MYVLVMIFMGIFFDKSLLIITPKYLVYPLQITMYTSTIVYRLKSGKRGIVYMLYPQTLRGDISIGYNHIL